MERGVDLWIGAASVAMYVFHDVVVKTELSGKATSVYAPTLAYVHKVWVVIKRIRSWVPTTEKFPAQDGWTDRHGRQTRYFFYLHWSFCEP